MNDMATSFLHRILKMGAAAAFALIPLAASAQDKITVPLTDPARPVTLRASLLNGGITVRGADVKEVTVETRIRTEDDDDGRDRKGKGMKRVPLISSGVTIEEENNTVRISADSHNRAVELTVTVPRQTSVRLRATNDGHITVRNIEGEIDVNNTNGPVTLTNVSGTVIAHALNDEVKVVFDRLAPGKPMAFSSLNGDIDVTFPADLKANLTVKSGNGDVYSDFDVQVVPNAPQTIVQDGRGKGGKYQVKMEKVARGTIGGGGPEFQFTNFNGDIYLRKAGASTAKD